MSSPSSIDSRVVTYDQLAKLLAGWRLKDDIIVFTNGCFDVLHPGHVRYLEAASHLGHRLIIGLNSDASVTRLKGPGRPVNPAADRAVLLAALHGVDAVVIFEEDTPEELIRLIRPNVLVKGADYTGKPVAGADFVKALGGKVELIALTEGYSSTEALKKIKER